MWTVQTDRPRDRRGTGVECQYLTDMLDAVKAAASQPGVTTIVIEKVKDD